MRMLQYRKQDVAVVKQAARVLVTRTFQHQRNEQSHGSHQIPEAQGPRQAPKETFGIHVSS